MDVLTHTVFALTAMYICFLWGKCLTHGDIAEDIIGKTLDKLENEGYIKIETNAVGDKTLVKIVE